MEYFADLNVTDMDASFGNFYKTCPTDAVAKKLNMWDMHSGNIYGQLSTVFFTSKILTRNINICVYCTVIMQIFNYMIMLNYACNHEKRAWFLISRY